MGTLGWAGILVPESHGGTDFGLAGMGAIMEEAGRHLSASPLLSTAVLGASLLRSGNAGDELKALASGNLVVAMALDEQGWHNPASVSCLAEKTASGFRIAGSKRFVADGHGADLYLVVARTSGQPGENNGLSVFAVPADSQGLSVTPLRAVDSRNSADLQLDGVEVPTSALIGEDGRGMEVLEPALDAGRACLAAEMLGGAQQVFDLTLDYLRERRQFGVPIGSFQSLQHRAADLYSIIELARSAVTAALISANEKPEDFPRLASLAKAQAGRAFHLASLEGVQMHGGIGVTDELDIGLYLKRARVAEQMLGDESWHSQRYAELSGF